MLATVQSSAVMGIDAYIVQVEIDIADGLPAFNTVGLPDSAVKESSRARGGKAINSKNSGFYFPTTRITANLAPADVRKEGSAFDLPIALGVLAATAQVAAAYHFDKTLVLGELALDGSIRLGAGLSADCKSMPKRRGSPVAILPNANAKEGAIVDDLNVYPVETLQEAVQFLNGERSIEPFKYRHSGGVSWSTRSI